MSAYEAAEAGYRDEGLGAGSGGAMGGTTSGAMGGATGGTGRGSAWFAERPTPPPPGPPAPPSLPTASALDGDVFGDPAYDGPGDLYIDSVFVDGATATGTAFGRTEPRATGGGSDALRLVIVSAGLGQPSTARILADRLADTTRARLAARGRAAEVEVLELRDLALDIAGAMVAGFPGTKLRAALDTVEAADGLIAVSPIYTASYSGLFKSFFDVLDKDALTAKPTLIAATGGTARHSLALDHALRPMFAYLRAFVVPTAVFAASEDWASSGGEGLTERVERAGAELAGRMAGAPAAVRKPRDEFEDVIPFEQRMAALRSGL